MRALRRESNEDSYWWLDGEAPKNASRDVGSRSPVRLFEEFLRRRQSEMRASGPLYLAIIQRPNTDAWYAKSKMGEYKLSSIMRTLAKTLIVDGKRISNHSTRKSVVAKLNKAGQPRHEIIQITSHAKECSLNDYDEVDKGKGGLCPTSLVATSTHPRQQEVQKPRRALVPCEFLVHHPLLCI